MMNSQLDFAYLVGRKLTPELHKNIEKIVGDGLLRVYKEGEVENKKLNRNRVNLTITETSAIVDVWMG